MIPLIAQDPKPAEGGGRPADGGFNIFPLMIGLMVIFFVIVVMPARRKQKQEQEKLQASLKVGAKVVTSSGILGTIAKMKEGDEEIVIRSEDAKIRVLRTAILRVLGEESAAETKS